MPRPNESRPRIMEAAEHEFARRGFFPANMDAIAERAGVAKGTLYYNFSSKADLFVEVVTGGIEYLASLVRRAANLDEPIGLRIVHILETQIDMLYQYPRIAAILFRELSAGLDNDVRLRIAEVRTDYVGFLAGLIAGGIKEGVLMECDPDLAAAALVDVVYATCDHQLAKGGGKEEALRFLTSFVTGGLVRAEARR